MYRVCDQIDTAEPIDNTHIVSICIADGMMMIMRSHSSDYGNVHYISPAHTHIHTRTAHTLNDGLSVRNTDR